LKRLILISSLFFFIFTGNITAQSNYKSPKKAALLSLVPGVGQAYTKKYWKIPIIYSALLASGYYINDNNSKYVLYRDTYLNRMDGINDDLNYTDSQLITLKDFYKRNREISIMLFSLSYILNIIDASVNAHLFEYEVSEDISFKIEPIMIQNNYYSALKLNIQL